MQKRIISLIIIALLIMALLSGCGKKEFKIKEYYSPSVSSPNDEWSEASGEFVTIENESVSLSLNTETTHFSVTNKKDGKVYTSVPEGDISSFSEELFNRVDSEITVRYYEEQSDAMFLFSNTDSVKAGQFQVLTKDDAIRVIYEIGEVGMFAPTVLDEQNYNTIIETLGSSALQRRFERYYAFYSSAEQPDDYNEKLKLYPVLSKTPLYILDDFVSDVDRSDIASYLLDANYTVDDYNKMLNSLGMEQDAGNDVAGFVVPVEYSLTDDGFSAEILSDLITEKSDKYKLQSVDLLEYFAASSEEGSFFVPDGSGAIIDFNKNVDGISVPYYGSDLSIREEAVKSIDYNMCMPVFGATLKKGGFFAIINTGAEFATLNAMPSGGSNPLNHIYPSFAMRTVDATDYGTNLNIPVFNLFSKGTVKTSPKVTYALLEDGNNTYTSMADYYRKKLIEDKMIAETKTEKAPVYLDYLCMITQDASVMGVPYTDKIVLSTVSDITKSVEKVIAADIGPCVVRLIGYGPCGYEHKAYSKFAVDKKVGTTQQLKDLQKLLKKNGGELYLDADMQYAYKSGNGFSTSDSARHLNRLVVCRGSVDLVTMKYNRDLLRYLISPSLYPSITEKMNQSLKKAFGKTMPGVSYGTIGLEFGSDFTQDINLNRAQSLALINAALKKTQKEKADMMFDGGNGYVFPYAKHLLNVATKSSDYDAESSTVPFYEMVIYNTVNYAGSALNLSTDSASSYLDSAAFGCSAYSAFITKSDTLISNTPYENKWYSLQDAGRLTDFIEKARKLNSVKADAAFVKYEKKNDSVSVSYFADSTKVYVNYGNKEQVIDGVTVPARDFTVGR